MSDALLYQSGSPASEIILSQPSKRNAINAAMWRSLGDVVRQGEADTDAKVLVVRGEGDHFAAGADITEFEKTYATRDSAAAYTQTMLAGLDVLANCTKPTIAMIHGACVGGGCSIALSCDFRFAGKSARMGVTPGKLGLVYALADTRRLAATVGVSSAKDLLFTGRLVDAAEAQAMRLCDRVYLDDSLRAETLKFAQQIAETSQWSVRATKRTIEMLENDVQDASDDAMAIMLDSFSGADFREGYRAFLNKRKPNFPTK